MHLRALAAAWALTVLGGCSSGIEEQRTKSELLATGAFAALGEGTYALATSNLPCQEVSLFLTEERLGEEGETCTGCARLFLELPHPFFLGRVYGPGTLLDPTQGWWITDGTVTVRDLAWTEEIGMGEWYIELAFDAALRQTAALGWDDLVSDPSDSRLTGWVRFSYSGFKYRSSDAVDCPPPDRAPGPTYEESMGMGPVAGPLEESPAALAALPVAWTGTAGARVDAALLVRHVPTLDLQARLSVAVAQDVSASANPLCAASAEGTGSQGAGFCPGTSLPSFSFDSAVSPLPATALTVSFANAWNLPLSVALPTQMADPPRLTSPAWGDELPSADPIDVTWAPSRAGETVTLRLVDVDGVVAWQAVVPDSGSAQIPASAWAMEEVGYDLELEKTASVAPPFPLAEGSSLRSGFVDVARLALKPWRDWAFTDPSQGSAGWLAPEVVAEDAVSSGAPDHWAACAFPDGSLAVGWLEAEASGATRLVLRRSAAAGWGPRAEVELGTHDAWTGLGLSCAEAGALLFAQVRSSGLWRPGAALFPTSGAPIAVDGAALGEAADAYLLAGAVLADGSAALAGLHADGNLYGVWGGASRQLTSDGTANPLSLQGYPLGGAVLALSTHRGDDFVLTHWEPANPGAPREVAILSSYTRDCAAPVGVAALDQLWTLCAETTLGRLSPLTGAPLGPGEAVTSDRRLTDTALNQELEAALAVGPAGHAFVLYTLPCDWGRCPMVFRRDGTGAWSGPLYPGWAPGPSTLVVDAAGAPHLFWSTGEGLAHTREVP